MYLSTGQDAGRKFENKREILPKVVQLGGSLPSKRAYENKIWTPTSSERKETTSKNVNELPNVKCRKFKNLFEYNQKYKDTFNLKRNLWKIPSLGNNFLPFQNKGPHKTSEEVVGLYRPKFQRWYSRLVHENTVILPPIETSERVKYDLNDPNNLNEKKYIAEQHQKTGPRERFTRDELYIPDVYSQCFTCRECRKEYANDVFNQTCGLRSDTMPLCHSSTESAKREGLRRQHCDVLGERYCKACIEKRNKSFSLKIEDKLLNNNDLKKVHYKSSLS